METFSMSKPMPQFDAPPVVETVLGVQFKPLAQFSEAHVGWYWKNFLPNEWPVVRSAPRLEDQFETDQKQWVSPGIKFRASELPDRVQLIRRDEERMIQVQDSRFILNWRKKAGAYPSFRVLQPEFFEVFDRFNAFVKDAELGVLDINQWEITYVNHVGYGALWNSLSDWQSVIPGFYLPPHVFDTQLAESFGGVWHHTLGDGRGRLHITIRHVKVGSSEGSEVLEINLTARGPVSDEPGFDFRSGFELGHESIVRTFAEMTSPESHRHWQRRCS